MRSARLLGHQHHALDAVAAVAERAAAISICRGGANKTYSHTDPNEDAACFAFGGQGTLVAVADGHHGARGAERAIDWLLSNAAARWTGDEPIASDPRQWCEAASSALRCIHREVIAQGRELRVDPAPTTFSLALVRPADDLLVHASVGDSHVFVAAPAQKTHAARDVAWATTGKNRCYFAGASYEGGDLAETHWVVGCEPLGATRAVLLATDGLSEVKIGVEDPEAAAARAVDHAAASQPALRPLEACRHLTETALEAQRQNRAGDNISVAVIWLEP